MARFHALPPEVDDHGATVALCRRTLTGRTAVAVDQWEGHEGFSRLLRLYRSGAADSRGVTAATVGPQGLHLTHAAVAALPDDVARKVGLGNLVMGETE